MRMSWVVSLLRTLFLASLFFSGIHDAEAQRDILSEVQTVRKEIAGTFNARVSVPKGLGTSLWESVARGFSGDVAERYDTYYNASFDYLRYSSKATRYAEEFAKSGDVETATKYLDKADHYIKMSQYAWGGASEQLDAAYSVAMDRVVYEAAKTALGFAVGGVGASLVTDGIGLYTDYLLDKELVGVDEAKKNVIKGALAKVFLKVPIGRLGGKSLSEAINKGVTKTIGGSGIHSFLDELIGKPQFQKEFMRIASDSLGYISIKEAEWLLEKMFDTPVGKKAEFKLQKRQFKTQYAKSIPKDMNDLLHKITESEAFETFKNIFNYVTPYLPTTTKALARVNQQDSTQSVAHLDPGHPDLNAVQTTLASLKQSSVSSSTLFFQDFHEADPSEPIGLFGVDPLWEVRGSTWTHLNPTLSPFGEYLVLSAGAGTTYAGVYREFTLSGATNLQTSLDYRPFSTSSGTFEVNFITPTGTVQILQVPNTLVNEWTTFTSDCVSIPGGTSELELKVSPTGQVTHVDNVKVIQNCQP